MASYAIYLLCWGKMWTVCRKQWHDWLFSFYDEGKAWISIIQRSVQFDIQPFPIIDIFEWYETYKSYVNYVAMLSRREDRERKRKGERENIVEWSSTNAKWKPEERMMYRDYVVLSFGKWYCLSPYFDRNCYMLEWKKPTFEK